MSSTLTQTEQPQMQQNDEMLTSSVPQQQITENDTIQNSSNLHSRTQNGQPSSSSTSLLLSGVSSPKSSLIKSQHKLSSGLRLPSQTSQTSSIKNHNSSVNLEETLSSSERSSTTTRTGTTKATSKKRKISDSDNIGTVTLIFQVTNFLTHTNRFLFQDSMIRGTLTERFTKRQRPTARYSDLGGIDNVLKDIRGLQATNS
jgi:hypothetical protein